MRTVLLLLLAGCASTEPAGSDAGSETARCMQLAGEHLVAANAAGEDKTECAVDADCVLVTPLLECAEGDHYEECPMAIAADEEAAFLAQLAADTAYLCEDGLDCLSIPGCPPSEAVCESGQCSTPATAFP